MKGDIVVMKTNEMPKVVAFIPNNEFEFQIYKLVTKDDYVRRSYPTKPPKGVDERTWKIGRYIWRHIVFFVSPVRQHQCMPVLDIFYLPEDIRWDDKEKIAELDKIVDRIVECIPKAQWHSVMRWAKVLF